MNTSPASSLVAMACLCCHNIRVRQSCYRRLFSSTPGTCPVSWMPFPPHWRCHWTIARADSTSQLKLWTHWPGKHCNFLSVGREQGDSFTLMSCQQQLLTNAHCFSLRWGQSFLDTLKSCSFWFKGGTVKISSSPSGGDGFEAGFKWLYRINHELSCLWSTE